MDSKRYDNRVRPVVNHSKPTKVAFSMSLYQILSINEKMQSVDLNVWVIQKWRDEFLGWNPLRYGQINTTILPYDLVWLPDTYLYNSVVMNREETERYINVVLNTEYWDNRRGAQIKFMYPALYRTSCKIQIRYFPYDQQNCTLLISSWTSDKSSIDYVPEFNEVNLENFIPNEEWVVVSFEIRRIEEKFVCCPEPWVLLEASLVVRRKPLYYIVNLVVPTSVITLVAVTGFFTPASTSNERREKLSLGIDSLLAMSILMMMISEQMPTTSDYVPLFGLFYLSIIFIIFVGTLFTAFVLNVHLQKQYNKPIPPLIAYIFFYKVAPFLSVHPSTSLLELWIDTGVRIRGLVTSKRPSHQSDKSRHSFREAELAPDSRCRYVTDVGQIDPPKSARFEHQTLLSELLDINLKNVTRNTIMSQSAEMDASRRHAARENWRRLARLVTLQRYDSIMMRRALPDIPYVDISPGRVASASKVISTGTSPPRRTPSPINAAMSRASITSATFQPSRPLLNDINIDLSNTTAILPSLRLFNLPELNFPQTLHSAPMPSWALKRDTLVPPPPAHFKSSATRTATGGGALGGVRPLGGLSRDVVLFDSKLRRRNAYEWEFLASVLDRVLLILFSAIVTFVTAAMLIIGEAIHLSYYFGGPGDSRS